MIVSRSSATGTQPSEPRCPRCGWALRFEAVEKSWVARCWNKRSPSPCPVEVVPPSINEALVEWLRGRGEVKTADVAEAFGYKLPNANNHLTALFRLGIIDRQRMDPVRRGKAFAWRLA